MAEDLDGGTTASTCCIPSALLSSLRGYVLISAKQGRAEQIRPDRVEVTNSMHASGRIRIQANIPVEFASCITNVNAYLLYLPIYTLVMAAEQGVTVKGPGCKLHSALSALPPPSRPIVMLEVRPTIAAGSASSILLLSPEWSWDVMRTCTAAQKNPLRAIHSPCLFDGYKACTPYATLNGPKLESMNNNHDAEYAAICPTR
ncbi:uncharacterized protein EI97DRAFT_103178 [Westerdykella ornata]|uniref:Uncharacterized protein n=1 Tax=Westerdykella ornata TaxID=318751 RepID=A0A6A6JEJ9_WESOR|nr:uncharacterized protein EI97DRAFT_103178 [Westerdykella ornata]KAF2274593.1 hypothetical protein EI97DRAFT_103178 [Westerdykella ornata]